MSAFRIAAGLCVCLLWGVTLCGCRTSVPEQSDDNSLATAIETLKGAVEDLNGTAGSDAGPALSKEPIPLSSQFFAVHIIAQNGKRAADAVPFLERIRDTTPNEILKQACSDALAKITE